MCDTLPSSAVNLGDNTVSVAHAGTAAPGATKQLWFLLIREKRYIN